LTKIALPGIIVRSKSLYLFPYENAHQSAKKSGVPLFTKPGEKQKRTDARESQTRDDQRYET